VTGHDTAQWSTDGHTITVTHHCGWNAIYISTEPGAVDIRERLAKELAQHHRECP
jgi:hypothetical protein